MKYVQLMSVMIAAGVMLVCLWSCDNGNGPTCEHPDSLVVVEPAAQETVVIGQDMTITWRYPEDWGFGQMRIFFSDNQLLSTTLIDTPKVTEECQQSVSFTVPNDATPGPNGMVMVQDYEGIEKANSEPFVIVEAQ